MLPQYKDGSVVMKQKEKILKLEIHTNEKSFTSHRALTQYIGVKLRPGVSAPVQLIVPGSEPVTKQDYAQKSLAIRLLLDTDETGLKFVPLDQKSVRLMIVSEESFTNPRGGRIQLGFVQTMLDRFEKGNIIHYASSRCRRIARGVMAAEAHAFVIAFDFAFVIGDILTELLGIRPKIEALVDSKTLFPSIAKDC